MSLQLSLDREQGSALYRQIAEQIKDRISDGRLPTQAQLPTVRELAKTAGVTRLTVQNAYAELQSAGWIEATVGRGTFVSGTMRPIYPVESYDQPLTADSVIRNILHANHTSGVRAMSNASPDPKLFPEEEFWSALSSMRGSFASVSTYGSSQGDPALLVELATYAQERGIDATPDEIVVTDGASHGFALVLQTLCRPGDRVLVEQPTYLGSLNTIRGYGIQPIGVPMDEEGVRLDLLERIIIQERPRFLYVMPTFQNPTGVSMSLGRRQELIVLAERHGILLVEDDIYGRLSYDSPPPPTLKSLDRGGTVIYLTSFSKTLMPSLRLGFVMAPPPLHQRVLAQRRASNLCGSLILQRTLAEFLRSGAFRRHIKRVLPIYRERRDTMMSALQQWMPTGVQWTRPSGGLSCWITLPNQSNMADVALAAQQQGWSFAPGEVFLAQPQATQHLRIAYGQTLPEMIRSGMEVLSRLVRERLAQKTNGQVERLRDWTPMV